MFVRTQKRYSTVFFEVVRKTERNDAAVFVSHVVHLLKVNIEPKP